MADLIGNGIDMVADTFGVVISFYSFQGESINTQTGAIVKNYAAPIGVGNAILMEVTVEEIQAAGGKYRQGDTRCVIVSDRLGATVPKIGDKVTRSGVDYRVEDVKTHVDGSWSMIIRRAL